ncbi:placenta-expressed transcript 1 protein [Meriones unguiculatus]|uniref:placenta-expressed transcript 1 protein n=1 Tax=Meriones unguiculatus TaxID=10047 RepID=UPI000B4EC852|nr:placenta-expressed transcript 1 protein [Meriones unguiculatus]
MAVLRSVLPHLRLLVCLALHFSPAFSASDNDSCVIFDKVFSSDTLGINITEANIADGYTTYTVTIPVNNSVRAVILKAVTQSNDTVGTWVGATEGCNGTSFYDVTHPNNSAIQTTWKVPESEDLTTVDLQVFRVINRTALVSSVSLEQTMTSAILTPALPTISETIQTTTMTIAKNSAMTTVNNSAMTTANNSTMTTAKTTAMTTANNSTMTTAKPTAKTTAMTTNLAISTLSSPLAATLHIMLVFLISKLLF